MERAQLQLQYFSQKFKIVPFQLLEDHSHSGQPRRSLAPTKRTPTVIWPGSTTLLSPPARCRPHMRRQWPGRTCRLERQSGALRELLWWGPQRYPGSTTKLRSQFGKGIVCRRWTWRRAWRWRRRVLTAGNMITEDIAGGRLRRLERPRCRRAWLGGTLAPLECSSQRSSQGLDPTAWENFKNICDYVSDKGSPVKICLIISPTPQY